MSEPYHSINTHFFLSLTGIRIFHHCARFCQSHSSTSMPKPIRTINVYDKGSNYLLLDNDDITPLYHIHFNTHTLPHMVVSRSSLDPSIITGSATFFPEKKIGFFSSASTIGLTVNDNTYNFDKKGGGLRTNKRTLQTQSHGTLYWKGGYAASGFLKLVDDNNRIIADYVNKQFSGRKKGIIEIMSMVDVDDAFLDEIVVSGIAMLSEESTSMGAIASNMASAGGM